MTTSALLAFWLTAAGAGLVVEDLIRFNSLFLAVTNLACLIRLTLDRRRRNL